MIGLKRSDGFFYQTGYDIIIKISGETGRGGKTMIVAKIMFALLVSFPIAALCYYFLKKLVDELYKNRSSR